MSLAALPLQVDARDHGSPVAWHHHPAQKQRAALYHPHNRRVCLDQAEQRRLVVQAGEHQVRAGLSLLVVNLDQVQAKAIAHDVATIRSAAGKMAQLLDELLNLSRVGRVDHRTETLPAAELVREAAELASGSIRGRGVELSVTSDLGEVRGDRRRLVELFQNLLENAVKFMGDQTAPRVAITGATDAGDAVLRVTDNGIGIGSEYTERIFVIFQRLHTRDAYPGTGIGLAMCKKIVEFHGGTIAVDTGQTPGTKIVFTLPAAP